MLDVLSLLALAVILVVCVADLRRTVKRHESRRSSAD